MDYLKDQGLAEYFVFPSINWSPKGARIKQLISDMQLRPANVLFLDDNPSNLAEASYSCPGIMTGPPALLPQLLADAENSLAEAKLNLDVFEAKTKERLRKEYIEENEKAPTVDALNSMLTLDKGYQQMKKQYFENDSKHFD